MNGPMLQVDNVTVCFRILRERIPASQEIYPNWELCVAEDDCSTRPEILAALRQIDDPHCKVKFLQSTQGIAGASNAALALDAGKYVAFPDHDDQPTPDALYHAIQDINDHDPDLVYAESITAAILRLLDGLLLRQRLTASGLSTAARFRHRREAPDTLAWIERILASEATA